MIDPVIEKSRTALVVIDLQKGIAMQPTKPYPSPLVIKNAALLANTFRSERMPVFLVHVVNTKETALNTVSDETFVRSYPLPTDWSDFVPEMSPGSDDIVIGKKQWGAFYGTDLDLQLRRRGLDTIVLCGIATNFGVESTARFAYEYGYQQIFAEDAMSAMIEEGHHASVKYVFPRLGRVRKTAEIVSALR